MLLFVLGMCSSCCASPKEKVSIFFTSQKEDGYGKILKDSIVSIVINAKTITCELQSKNPIDTLRQDTIKIVPEKLHSIIQYLFFNTDNFQSADTVYAKFDSWVRYKFETKKKQAVYLELDFGLRKWRLLDANNKAICTQDMKELNTQFLYFTRLLFPKDLTLNLMSENLKAAK